MDSEILKTFLDEAEGYLPTLRRGIVAYEQDSAKLAKLQETRRQAHTIKGSALMLELTEIGEIAREIESEIKEVVKARSVLTENQANDFLSKILILESYLKELRTESDENEQEKLIESSQTSPTEIELIEQATPQSESQDFEIDAEMLEVFALEAEDLLRNIGANLEILEENAVNREALLEIRRSSHTLKGSAGIIGLKKISALAHRVEDLLDFLSENEIEGDEQIFKLLQASFDCLSALANNEDSSQLERNIEQIYQTFNEVLAKLKTEKIPHTKNSSAAGNEEQAEDSPPEISAKTERGENIPVETAAPNRSVIRVSFERLNDLFNLANEIVITRSVFEQRLSEMERQIRELHHTTRRLRASTDKLEIDFETSPPAAIHNQISGSPGIFKSSASGFDELEFDRYTEFHQTTRELIETASDASAINTGLDHLLENLNSVFDNQRRLIEGIQSSLLRLRMVSLGSLAPRLQRTVQMTAQEEEKLADLIIEDEQIEIDAEIMDAVAEPLLHLLRNAVVHGIETAKERRKSKKPERGKIILRAFSEGTHLVFAVEDDGRGISVSALKEKAVRAGFISKWEADAMTDEDAFLLVFLPGLSTAKQVTQASGRGVGMNIVKTGITRRNGTISVKSEEGCGTTFMVRLPVSLAVTRGLLVKAGNQTFAFPLNLVKQATEISASEFDAAVKNTLLSIGENSYSFIHFNQLLNLPSPAPRSAVQILLLKTAETPLALAVDQILKTEEIVIKPLGSLFANISQITGATILGDGSVVPVLDLVYLIKNQDFSAKKNQKIENENKSDNQNSKILNVLIVDDSPSVRLVNANLIKKAGWKATAARDGLEALEMMQAPGGLPDIILTDVEMPRMNGYELLASLKKQSNLAQIPVIMITSRAGDKHRRKAFDLGADDYLSKPYEDTVLLDKIKALTKIV